LRSVTVPADLLEDNWWANFDFPPIINSQLKTFILKFSLQDKSAHSRLAIYDQGAPAKPVRRVLRRLGLIHTGQSLYCRMRWLR
jgi:hypothetical protein